MIHPTMSSLPSYQGDRYPYSVERWKQLLQPLLYPYMANAEIAGFILSQIDDYGKDFNDRKDDALALSNAMQAWKELYKEQNPNE